MATPRSTCSPTRCACAVHNVMDRGRAAKVAQIDLDYIYDKDPEQTEENLGRLLDRVQKLGINTVYLQAFADPDANGAADAVYFNRHIPMRADLFNRVAWQLLTRTQVKRVFAWMPLLACAAAGQRSGVEGRGGDAAEQGQPPVDGLSAAVAVPAARAQMGEEIYEDLGRHAPPSTASSSTMTSPCRTTRMAAAGRRSSIAPGDSI